ncbi:MAG TPA: hypothetical protein EYH54_03660 [Nautiliaceae bacterium]|nr:hypothetical protein [Nautiliaceae bacterium]
MEKTVVIFANSVKHNNHCVAGKDIYTKKWIRPVADANGSALTTQQIQITNSYKTFPVKPLQKVKIKFLKHAPLINQPENYVIKNSTWIQEYNLNKDEIFEFIDTPKHLWIDGISDNDRVDYQLIKNEQFKIYQSLYLIKVDEIYIYWKDRSEFGYYPQRRGKFEYKGIIYDLAITDPNFKELKEQCLYDKILCVSLGGNFNGYCYKIIASII